MEQDWVQSNQWMNSASSGNLKAFGKLAVAVQNELYRFALACGLHHADAAEVTQETLMRAYKRRKDYRPDANVKAWMLGIAMNVVHEFRRRNRRYENTWNAEQAWGATADCDRPGVDEELQRLTTALESLPPRQREAIGCRFLRGMSVRDTAAAMDCAEGTVKAAIYAALGNLRKKLKGEA